MTVAKELDDWTAALQAETSVHATRDPDLVHPPCLFVGLPEVVTSPQGGGQVLNLPLYVVCGGSGKQQGDELLNLLPAVLTAVGQTQAAQTSVTIGDIPFTAYQVTVPVRLTPVTPVAPSPPGMPVAVDIKPAEPGWYTCSVTWTAPVSEGSSPITHYEVVVNGVTNITPDDSLIVTGIRVPAGSQYQVYVIAVNSEAKSSPSDSNIIYPPPT
jgi:hypothetical protein